jgi:hypothetical protein
MAINSGVMVAMGHMYFSLVSSSENPTAMKISTSAESTYMYFHSPANSHLLVSARSFNFIIIDQHVSSKYMCVWSLCHKNKALELPKSKN